MRHGFKEFAYFYCFWNLFITSSARYFHLHHWTVKVTIDALCQRSRSWAAGIGCTLVPVCDWNKADLEQKSFSQFATWTIHTGRNKHLFDWNDSRLLRMITWKEISTFLKTRAYFLQFMATQGKHVKHVYWDMGMGPVPASTSGLPCNNNWDTATFFFYKIRQLGRSYLNLLSGILPQCPSIS